MAMFPERTPEPARFFSAEPETITLNNGKQYQKGLTTQIIMMLRNGLKASNPRRPYFVDLVKKCRQPEYQWQVPRAEDYFILMGLTDFDNTLRSYVKEITVCSTEGEGAELRVVDPETIAAAIVVNVSNTR
jgi:hypothetical protein